MPTPQRDAALSGRVKRSERSIVNERSNERAGCVGFRRPRDDSCRTLRKVRVYRYYSETGIEEDEGIVFAVVCREGGMRAG